MIFHEYLCQITISVYFVLFPVHFKHRDVVLSVNFITRRMPPYTFGLPNKI